MDQHQETLEKALEEAIKQKEETDKQMLELEIVLGFISAFAFLGATFCAAYFAMTQSMRVCLIVLGSIALAMGVGYCIKIEQTAGYYECAKCHHRYIPQYMSVFLAPHINRTRYMRCPECNQKSWQKKVISKK